MDFYFRFARLAAAVFLHADIKTYLFSDIVPTPFVVSYVLYPTYAKVIRDLSSDVSKIFKAKFNKIQWSVIKYNERIDEFG